MSPLARRVIANLPVDDVESAEFYTSFLGLDVQEFSLGWVARYTTADGDVAVQLVTHDRTSPVDSDVSVMVDDVDEAHRAAVEAGYEVVHGLVTESWGVRRFLVRAPGGAVVNVVQHHD